MRRTTAIIALAVALVGTSAGAQETASGAADALFREAVALAQGGKFDEAAKKFEASFALDPALGTLLGHAMALEQGGKIASAFGRYGELADRANAVQDHPRMDAAALGMARLRPRLPKLLLLADADMPRDIRWSLDGADLPSGAFGTALPMDPGDHVLRAHRGTEELFSRIVSLEEGRELRVSPSVPNRGKEDESRAIPPPEQPTTTVRTLGWVVGGVGVASLGVGTVYWRRSNLTYNDLQEQCAAGACPADRKALIDRGKQEEAIGRVGLIAGGVGVLTGVTLLLLAPSDVGRRAKSAQRVEVGPRSLVFSGTF